MNAPGEVPILFIPGDDAARCADCGGFFPLQLQRCPGCTSVQYQVMAEIDAAQAQQIFGGRRLRRQNPVPRHG